MSHVQKQLEVYEPSTPFNDPPDDHIPYGEGQKMVYSGAATFVKHGKAIRLEWPSVGRAGTEAKYRHPAASLGAADAEALAEATPMTRRARERLIGWGFVHLGRASPAGAS
jgi:hypothetical protein